jgi:F-type H+-transporting ATPase subunit epsilon
MAYNLKLEIVTPEAKVYSDHVDAVTLTGTEGEMGILPNHVPLLTQLVAGQIVARKGQETIFLAVGDGFVEVTGEHVLVLTDMAIRAENMDAAKVEEARRRAKARLADKAAGAEEAAVQASIAQSRSQIKVKRRR